MAMRRGRKTVRTRGVRRALRCTPLRRTSERRRGAGRDECDDGKDADSGVGFSPNTSPALEECGDRIGCGMCAWSSGTESNMRAESAWFPACAATAAASAAASLTTGSDASSGARSVLSADERLAAAALMPPAAEDDDAGAEEPWG